MKKWIIATIVSGIGGLITGILIAPEVYALNAKKYFDDDQEDQYDDSRDQARMEEDRVELEKEKIARQEAMSNAGFHPDEQ